jgi:K+-transporting ATPase ATPase C chain
MNTFAELGKALRITLILWVLTAFLYPLLIWLIGQAFFPQQANGSLLKNAQGEAIGSALIGQSFQSDRYFWGRPSAIDYSSAKEVPATGVTGASNLAPSNPDLLEKVKGRIAFLKENNLPLNADLLYTSGSGLDPHIGLDSARAQVGRVAKARGLDAGQVESLVAKNVEPPFLGIFGDAGINVLKLNLALDRL